MTAKPQPPLSELIDHYLTRRQSLKMAGTAILMAACQTTGAEPAPQENAVSKKDVLLPKASKVSMPSNQPARPFQFTSAAAKLDAMHHLSAEYEAQVLLRWGDPIFAEPKLDAFSPLKLTAEEQAKRFGYNNDFLAYIPLTESSGLLVVNHESTNASLMFPNERGYASSQKSRIEIEMMAHGLSIVEIRCVEQKWEVVLDSQYNRRITAKTPIRFSGPVAGHKRLTTPEDPTGTLVLGTVHNCSGGVTPWGTILTCEENILYYFQGKSAGTAEHRNHRRFGIGHPGAYKWHLVDKRFKLSHALHQPNRFGWVVEIDPKDPTSTPVKRTALGRFCHESANPIINHDGRVVIYMGDDAKFEYLYRFVSEKPYSPNEDNSTVLDSGTLSAARFQKDGTVQWLDLQQGAGPLTRKNGFAEQADVLIEARRAAKLMGATPMDRVEDVEPNPITHKVYINLTKNRRRGDEKKPGADAANPRNHNRSGHIIELQPPKVAQGADHAARKMQWDILLLAGNPKQKKSGARYNQSEAKSDYFGCPDNACFDPQGRLWISTDGSPRSVRIADGLYAIDTEGEHRGRAKRLFLAPVGAEVTGPCFSPDGHYVFVSVQHPGSGSYAKPSTRWPDFDKNMPPRPSVVVIRRKDGGVIGG